MSQMSQKKTEIDTSKVAQNIKQATGIQTAMDAANKLKEGDVSMPSNKDIHQTMEQAKQALEETKSSSKVTPAGEKIIEDTKNVVQSAQDWLSDKNKDENFQKMLEAAKNTAQEVPGKEQAQGAGKIMKNKLDLTHLQKQARMLLKHSMDLGTELASSASFRNNLFDLFNLLTSMMTDSDSVQQFLDTSSAKMKEKVGEAKERMKQKPTVETAKNIAKETTQQAKRTGEKMKTTKLTDQQVSMLEDKLLEILQDIGNRERSRKATNSLLSMGDHIAEVIKSTKPAAEGAQSALQQDTNAREILNQARTIFERIAGGHSLDTLFGQLNTLQDQLQSDQQARDYLNRLGAYLRKAMEDPSCVKNDQFLNEGRSLIWKGRDLADQEGKNYRQYFQDLLNEGRSILDSIQEDPKNVALRNSVQKLMDDIFYQDEKGLHLRDSAFEQMRIILGSIVTDQLREIPIPPVHIRDEQRDVHISNIVLNVGDITPDNIRLEQTTKVGIHPKDTSAELKEGTARLKLENIITHLKNVHFDYKSMSFPKVEESGIADLDIGGRGMSIDISLSLNKDNLQRPLVVNSVDVSIDSVSLQVQHTKRDTLWNFVMWLFSGVVRRKIQNLIKEHLEAFFGDLNERIALTMKTVTPIMQQGMAKTGQQLAAAAKERGAAMLEPAKKMLAGTEE